MGAAEGEEAPIVFEQRSLVALLDSLARSTDLTAAG